MRLFNLVIALVLLLLTLSTTPTASASLLSLDDGDFGVGSFTRDTVTGLEWLDMTSTLDMSMNHIKANSAIGQKYSELRYATQNEVESFFIDAGLDPAIGGIYSKTRFDATIALLDLIGRAPGYGDVIYGITGTGPVDKWGHYVSAYVYIPGQDEDSYLSLTNIASQNSDELNWINADSSEPFLGSFLIRDDTLVPVPEPCSFILMVTGIAATGFLKRRKLTPIFRA